MSEDVEIDHGNGMVYHKGYYANDKLDWKGIRINGHWYGCIKSYNYEGGLDDLTGYYLHDEKVSVDNKEGYCYIWDRDEIV